MDAGSLSRRAVLTDALRRPELRRIGLVAACFQISELGAWIAITTVAHQRGGVDEAAFVVAAQLAPAAVAALFVGALADRVGVVRVLVGGLVVQGIGLLGVAALLATDAPSLPLYACAVVVAVAVVTSRPTMATVLPAVVDDPHELTAANAVMGWLQGGAMFLGPAITAVGFTLAGQEAPFVVFAVLTLGAAVVARGLHPALTSTFEPEEKEGPGPPPPEPSDATATARRAIRPVLAVLATHAFVLGALDLVFVIVAVDVTNGPPARAGWLNTAFGVGAILGGAASVLLIGRHRVWPAILAAGLVTLGSLSLVAVSDSPAFAALALVACGMGAAALEISTLTLLQRVATFGLLVRAFSLAEAFVMGFLLVGTLAVPRFVSAFSAEQAPVGIAVVALFVLAVVIGPMARSERRHAVPLDVLTHLRAVDLFAPLPAPTMETLARQALRRSVSAGTTVIRQGDGGDDYFVLLSGTAAVSIDDRSVGQLGPGEGFGELALLHDVPRTATVVITEDAELLVLDRRSFLVAVSGSPAAARASYGHFPAASGRPS